MFKKLEYNFFGAFYSHNKYYCKIIILLNIINIIPIHYVGIISIKHVDINNENENF